jgi:hypothetical protein
MKSRRRIVSPWIETMPKFGFGLHITDHRPSIVLRRGPIGRALTVMRLQRLDRAKQCLFPSSLTSDAVAAVLGFRLPVAARRRRRRAAAPPSSVMNARRFTTRYPPCFRQRKYTSAASLSGSSELVEAVSATPRLADLAKYVDDYQSRVRDGLTPIVDRLARAITITCC